MTYATALQYLLFQTKPIAETVEEVAQLFGVTESSNYALQFDSGIYVTHSNRKDVQKGMILVLTDSPVRFSNCNSTQNIVLLLF